MRKLLTSFAAATALATASLSAPVAAQDEMSPAQEAKMLEMMGSLFQADPLTPEQEARLPIATQVVNQVMPEGFYGEMMGEMMDGIMGTMFGMLTGPLGADGLITRKVGLDDDAMPELNDEEASEIVALLDPAAEQRGDVIQTVMTEWMQGMFTQMEPPMREGLSKAYAVRFDESELADVQAFFATDTGAKYATESMAIFADPQIMSAMMQTMPAVMGSLGDMAESMEAAMAELPEERGYDELSAAQRSRLAALLSLSEADLKMQMEMAAQNAEEMEEDSDTSQ